MIFKRTMEYSPIPLSTTVSSETRKEIEYILDHSFNNVLCAFVLQGQVIQSYLLSDLSEESLSQIYEMHEKSRTQVNRMSKEVERLRQLIFS